MSKGQRNKQTRREEDARLAAAFSGRAPVAGPWHVPEAVSASIPSIPKKALKREIGKQLNVAHKLFFETELAVILWVLAEEFGFGKVRLLRFVEQYKTQAKKVTDFYEIDYESSDAPPIFNRLLKERCGLDVSDLYGEKVFQE